MPAEDPGAVLKKACDDVVAAEELRPEYKDGKVVKTFCNIGARRVAKAMGCSDFDDTNLNADAMHGVMTRGCLGGLWSKVEARDAVLHALDGGLAFAAMTSSVLGAAHGHIATLRPEAMQTSGSLGKDVPVVANVGIGDPNAPLIAGPQAGIKVKRNWNCTASWAFPMRAKGDPDYFIWRKP